MCRCSLVSLSSSVISSLYTCNHPEHKRFNVAGTVTDQHNVISLIPRSLKQTWWHQKISRSLYVTHHFHHCLYLIKCLCFIASLTFKLERALKLFNLDKIKRLFNVTPPIEHTCGTFQRSRGWRQLKRGIILLWSEDVNKSFGFLPFYLNL